MIAIRLKIVGDRDQGLVIAIFHKLICSLTWVDRDQNKVDRNQMQDFWQICTLKFLMEFWLRKLLGWFLGVF